MKINFPLQSALAILAAGYVTSSAHGALVLHYNFEGSGTTVANLGSLGSTGNLTTYNASDVATDLRTASGTGVNGSGQAINLVSTPNAAGPYGITSGTVSLDLTSAFTISGWLNMSSWTSGTSVFRNNSGTDPSAVGINLLLTSSGGNNLQLGVNNGAAANFTTTSYGGTTGQWMFFAITWDGSTITFYRGDSSSLSSGETFAYTGGVANNLVNAFALGNTQAAANNRPLNGLMDDFRIYDNSFDATGINAIRLAAIPEPSQALLLLGGLGFCLLASRRKIACQ